MSAGDEPQDRYELGRMTEQMRGLVGAVNKLENTMHHMAKDLASQKDLDRVDATATDALNKANKANTRLDSFSTWEKIGGAILAAVVVGAVTLSR